MRASGITHGGEPNRMTRSRGSQAIAAILTLALLVILNSASAAAQGSTATLRGNVQDSTGGVLPGATVTLTNTGTKAAQTIVTDDRGQYLFAGVFPGTYDLKVEMSGFKAY